MNLYTRGAVGLSSSDRPDTPLKLSARVSDFFFLGSPPAIELGGNLGHSR